MGQVAVAGTISLDSAASRESAEPDESTAPGAGAVGGRLMAAYRRWSGCLAEVFDLIGELEATEAHRGSYADVVDWLGWHLGVSTRTARRWVRLARALAELPALRAALAAGQVSIDRVELLVRVATAENQAELVDLASRAEDLDELRQEIRDIQDQQDDGGCAPRAGTDDAKPEGESQPAELMTWWHDDALHLRGVIPGPDGVTVEKALLRLGVLAPTHHRTGGYRNADERRGEALIQMASEALAADGDHDRATIVVHIPAHDLVAENGDGWDAAGRIFTAAELARLACDARLQPALHDPSGVTVGVGRTTRRIEGWLRRLLEGRDQGCRFPGCGRTRWLHGHHLTPWSQNGPTNLDNLVSLCGFHHRLIHRDGWTISGNPNQRLLFLDSWGYPYIPPNRPDWTDQLLDSVNYQTQHRLEQLANAPP